MSARVSLVSKTCPSRALSGAVATGRRAPARAVATAPAAMLWAPVPSMTSVMLGSTAPLTWLSLSRAIAASTVAVASPVIFLTWLCPTASTHVVSSNGPFVLSPKMACPTKLPVGTCGATTASSSLGPPSRTGSRRLGKKKVDSISTTYLDEALADFSGYLTIDEVYDGPFCILSVVDNRRYNRLAFRVLEHDPTQDDVLAFLSEFKGQLDQRGLKVFGITTDGSSLYPKVLKKLWPAARHQICEFHVIKEITKAVLHALAKLRKEMAAQIPQQPRGRPRKGQEGQAWLIAWQKQRVADLFEHRYLFVRHHLSAAQQKQLRKLTHGRPALRTLRKIMDEVYRLFDRRCKTQTGLKKLQRLRRRVRRFKKLGKSLDKLKSPMLEKALEFLDDKLLGATSNAVERANRRFRKAQNSIYSVRTKEHLEQRLALDMHREQRAPKRQQTMKTLHHARSKPDSLH
jgi:Transposase